MCAAEAEATRANADVERYRRCLPRMKFRNSNWTRLLHGPHRQRRTRFRAPKSGCSRSPGKRGSLRAGCGSRDCAQQAQTQIGGAQAGVSEALGRLAQANTAPQQVAVSQAQSETAGATTEQLRAQVEQAELELSYTKIYATEDWTRDTQGCGRRGAGSDWPTASGDRSGRSLGHRQFQREPNRKNDAGQPVEISVDAYPDKVFKGHVDSIQAGTGARFSLIPPENATGQLHQSRSTRACQNRFRRAARSEAHARAGNVGRSEVAVR